MTAPLAHMLDRAIGTTRKAIASTAALAAQDKNAAAGVLTIVLDNQLLQMMATRELLAREARARTRSSETFWIVP